MLHNRIFVLAGEKIPWEKVCSLFSHILRERDCVATTRESAEGDALFRALLHRGAFCFSFRFALCGYPKANRKENSSLFPAGLLYRSIPR